ncbi:VOC family protein [Cytobacillus sp. FSL W7-1323]|uniref:Glyoxalase n=1 Tax=Cytobacillus kochii TaxID=859143 RepID=A0A248TFB9_9BACI|nr:MULTISPECIES: VOC family protein [Cytobacillus]ASV66810.1 glyoxalase [Cytobacillus kochii]MEA1854023.1 VOC family protein [Cytobacillus sp. OWB-43]
MKERLVRIGTTYLPVIDVEQSAKWYQKHLGAAVNYRDQHKAILDLANQSIFLIKAEDGERSQFLDIEGREHFSVTFEVDGLAELERLHTLFIEEEVLVGAIEDRGHAGKNFIFYDCNGNQFDVWSELSPAFKQWRTDVIYD